MSEIAPGALVAVLAAYAGGSFVGAAVAGQIAKRVPICHGLIVGVLLMAGGVATMFAIPNPLWFRIAGLLVFLPSAWWGAYSVNPPMPGQHEGWVPKPVPFVKSKEP
jgi:predicted MFS family arabinose efflux permease